MKTEKQILSIIKAACAKEREAMKAGDAAAVERLDALTTLAADIVLTPEETSAEDKALNTAAYIYIEQAYDDTSKLTDEDKQTIIRDFKAGSRWQKEQQPADWSAEDEEMLDAMIDIVSHSLYEPLCPREGMLAWLISLRPYPHWKPSEEQLEADLDALVDEVFDKYSSVDEYGQLSASFNRAELYSFIKKITRKEEGK